MEHGRLLSGTGNYELYFILFPGESYSVGRCYAPETIASNCPGTGCETAEWLYNK